MRRRRSMKRNFILLTVLTILIPFLIMGHLVSTFLSTRLEEEVTSKNKLLSRSLAAEVEEYLSDALELLYLIKRVFAEERLLLFEQEELYLEAVLDSYASFESLLVVSPQGRVEHRVPSAPGYLGLDLSQEPFFTRVMAGEAVYWSASYIPLHSSFPLVMVSIPLGDGVLTGYLDLFGLNEIVGRLELPAASFGAILDNQGTVVGHSQITQVLQRWNLNHLEGVQGALQGEGGAFFQEEGGEEFLTTLAPLKHTGWVVLISQPVEEVFALLGTIRWIMITGTVLAVGLVILLAYFSLTILLKPLKNLQESTQVMASGDYSQGITPSYYQELDGLERDFQKMGTALKEREKERENLIGQLQRANAQLHQFAEISAHHLQEPVRRLASYGRLLSSMWKETRLDEESRLALQYIEEGSHRLRRLLRDIQLYLSASHPRGPESLLETRKVVDTVLESKKDQVQASQARIQVESLPWVFMDRPRLTDIFTILLDNALKYTDKKSLPQIHIQGEEGDERVRFSVADNGPGIPIHYRERVFQVFERLHSGSGEETGIGLAIVRRIVNSCHGQVWIEESSWGGVVVVVELPREGLEGMRSNKLFKEV